MASKWIRIFFILLPYSKMNFFFQNSRNISKGETGISSEIKKTINWDKRFEIVFT